jgi:hypothetical protein
LLLDGENPRLLLDGENPVTVVQQAAFPCLFRVVAYFS